MAGIYVWERIVDHVVAALQAIDGSASASSTVNQASASGQPNIYLASLTGFEAGKSVAICKGGLRPEGWTVNSLGADHLVLSGNLVYEHTLAQADAVKQGWYNHDLGGRVAYWPEDRPPPWTGDVPEAAVVDGRKSNPELWVAQKTRYEQMLGLEMVARVQPGKTGKEFHQVYLDVVHDLTRAIMLDYTRGGWAQGTTIMEITPTLYEGLSLVGARMTLGIRYAHRMDDTARLI